MSAISSLITGGYQAVLPQYNELSSYPLEVCCLREEQGNFALGLKTPCDSSVFTGGKERQLERFFVSLEPGYQGDSAAIRPLQAPEVVMEGGIDFLRHEELVDISSFGMIIKVSLFDPQCPCAETRIESFHYESFDGAQRSPLPEGCVPIRFMGPCAIQATRTAGGRPQPVSLQMIDGAVFIEDGDSLTLIGLNEEGSLIAIPNDDSFEASGPFILHRDSSALLDCCADVVGLTKSGVTIGKREALMEVGDNLSPQRQFGFWLPDGEFIQLPHHNTAKPITVYGHADIRWGGDIEGFMCVGEMPCGDVSEGLLWGVPYEEIAEPNPPVFLSDLARTSINSGKQITESGVIRAIDGDGKSVLLVPAHLSGIF